MIDGYKADHRRQYPDGTEVVFSNLTPRKSRLEGVDFCVFFGLQYFIKEYLVKRFEEDFFNLPRDYVMSCYKKRLDSYLGGDFSVEHIGELWDLGYLPLEVRAVPEGTKVPIGVPCFTIRNTDPRFFWLTNQLETILSCSVWQACTSATIAHMYRVEFEKSAERTGLEKWFVDFQGHDFSFRGMSSFESACLSGAAHLLSFKGTDTIPAIDFIEQYYRGDGTEGCSVAASEHSVATLNIGSIGGDLLEAERQSILRLITEVYPTGVFSYVADSYDFWGVVTDILPTISNEIMARNGTLVIRPDTGTPELIICGDPNAPEGSPEYKGAFQCLWEIFGGTINDKGFKVLDSHVGLIYGDSITRERQKLILQGLEAKGFAPSVVLGIGSFTYNFNTRDTLGFAVKSTWGQVDGKSCEIFKSPKTDKGGEKKSAKGYLTTVKVGDTISLVDRMTPMSSHPNDLMETVFVDGRITKDWKFSEIKELLNDR
jgi:nicotinamide phosphoribosyltransferase